MSSIIIAIMAFTALVKALQKKFLNISFEYSREVEEDADGFKRKTRHVKGRLGHKE